MCRLSGLINACSGEAAKKYAGLRTMNWSRGALLATRTVADRLLRRPARPARCHVAAIVPGHGPVLEDHTYTGQVRTLLEAATTRVAAMAREGRSLEEIQRDLDLSDIRTTVPAWSQPEHDEDWRTTTRGLIERAWRGVRGQGG